MAGPMPVCVFLPHTVINQKFHTSYALGYWHASENNFLINCTAVVERKDQTFDHVLCDLLNYNLPGQVNKNICLLGLIYFSENEEHFETEHLKSYLRFVSFIIRINEVLQSFHVEDFNIKYFSDISVRVIIYDGYSITNSQLLPMNKNIYNCKQANETFIAFLVETCQSETQLNCREQLKSLQINHFNQLDNVKPIKIDDIFSFAVLWVISIFYKFTSFAFKRWPQWMKNFILLTALGQQFHQRYIHCSTLFDEFKSKVPANIKCKNLIFAIIIDLIFGCLVSYALLNSNIPSLLLNTAISKTNDIVSGLQNLINWLMGVPAGLKLNIPLNNALGKFFLYHIYLWESYMMVVQPLFSFIFKMSTVIGIFGLTFVLSLLNDLISLATIHIYCFYGYAARLYGYQVMSLAALWRLFRGKKWNPLRQRIDSYTYSVHQLYLGTLIFTVLLFLLPTVMVYYFVFTCLRILVLVIQGVMSRIINTLTICPLYSIVLRLFNSSETAGDVYFTVLNADGVLTLSMQASQIPIKTVIQLTVPDLRKYYEILTWKEFLSSIIWGKIVYPL